MKDKFLQDTLKYKQNDPDISKRAFQSIAVNLWIKNLYGKDKAGGIDEYDTEMLYSRWRYANIYSFIYKADTAAKYDDGNIKFEYYDSLPVVLITRVTKTYIRGINLNLCNFALRTLILNTFYNLDPEFFDHGALDMANKKNVPFSKNISDLLLTEEGENKIIQYFNRQFNLNHIEYIYRTYNISKIKKLRLIEIWQWKYIPFLKYEETIKQDVLQKIWDITNISKINI